MKRAIATIYAVSGMDEWTDVARRLEVELGWVPCYWLTQLSRNDQSVPRQFPEAVVQTSQDLNRGLPAPGFDDCFARPLDAALIAALLPHERVALQLMDRMDVEGSFTFVERRRTWYRLLAYWLAVIERLGARVALFNTPPHSIAEYVLYAAARHQGLATPIYQSTGLHGLLVMSGGVDETAALVPAYYRRALEDEAIGPGPACAAELERVRGADADATPWYVPMVQGQAARQHARYEKRLARAAGAANVPASPEPAPRWRRWLGLPPVPASAERTAAAVPSGGQPRTDRAAKPFRRVYKEAGRSLEESRFGRADYDAYLERVYATKLAMKKRYEAVCSPPDAAADFVYLPLHYQPERTTCPDGGVFNDQELAVAMVAAALPAGWSVYVKEHPTQFSYGGTGEQARSQRYYEDLAALPGVRLVPLETASLKLIDQARAVATVTGMAGWEALCRGRPVLVFGNAWYAPCRGAWRVSSLEECRTALAAVAAGARPGRREVDAFAAALESCGVRGYVNSSNSPAVQLSVEEHVDNLTRLLVAHARAGHAPWLSSPDEVRR